jgi:exodeoxyribonuclease X
MTTARIIDTETTGVDHTKDGVVEIAFVDLGLAEGHPLSMGRDFVNPAMPIPPEASALHHITDEDVKDAKPLHEVAPRFVDPSTDCAAYVAHNAPFDAGFVSRFDHERPWICTYRCALRAWPELPRHGNQFLRYALKLPVSRDAAHMPHRALSDALVTAYLFAELAKRFSVEQMVEWSKEPPLLTFITFGKHKGMRWLDLPDDYLGWMLDEPEMDADMKWNARRVRARRGYARAAKAAACTAASVNDLETWFKAEKDNRELHRIAKGDADFDVIVQACALRKADLLRSAPPLSPAPAFAPTTETANVQPALL